MLYMIFLLGVLMIIWGIVAMITDTPDKVAKRNKQAIKIRQRENNFCSLFWKFFIIRLFFR